MATDLSIQRQSDETDMEPHSLLPTLNRTQEEELLSDASNAGQTRKNAPFNKMPIIPLTGEFSEKNSMEATDENLVETSKIFQERPEQVTKRGRHPSPNRRFSFSLGHMTRSFSLKDNASVPQLSSTYVSVKSGPISNDSSSLSAANKEKNGHQRGRSSTLRRLLDPLLKPIGLLPVPSAETDQSPKESLNPFSLKPPLSSELFQNGKDITSSIRGFLHFSRRNGLPFFRFVVNKKGSIFAAPTKNSASMGRNASSCSYSFYTIDEIPKKSSSWISHGTKEKRCDFLYNVVAQMNVNCSSFSSCRGQNSTNQYVEKEFVLCGAELRKTDQASPGFTSTRELAAAVVRVCGESSRLAIQRNCYEDMTAKGFSPCTPVKECSCNLRMTTTVIFPGGIHGLPSKGVPSPLIQRWKSGGSCDCGGWDVGCKLHVLCSENRHCHIPKESEAQQDKPIFSLTPIHNGVHLVEFDSSISSLQAFFICVTIISYQKPCDLADEYTLSEDEGLCEPKGESEGPKNTNVIVPNKAPVSYTPSPPLSPVGRV
ncbi:hypothetical protein K2173_019603 [Erythroxylum novogranatense]|uniref:Uncharacterized protein n=1 Tax=Erythroxylum novogranatense TaxID=1862640 RepID=A0AAV8UBU5_9ROSI|nr:hypothetical protein K2173_019603 [Erythroxylum novogranatense]